MRFSTHIYKAFLNIWTNRLYIFLLGISSFPFSIIGSNIFKLLEGLKYDWSARI